MKLKIEIFLFSSWRGCVEGSSDRSVGNRIVPRSSPQTNNQKGKPKNKKCFLSLGFFI
jgi:hypothetical protein